jgi:hypothetical protein
MTLDGWIMLIVRTTLASVVLVSIWFTRVDALQGAQEGQRPNGFVAELMRMSAPDDEFGFVERQIERCMNDAGLAYEREPVPEDRQNSRETREAIGFGVSIRTDRSVAERRLETPVSPERTGDRWRSEFSRCYRVGLEAADARVDAGFASLPAELADEIRSARTLSHPVMRAATDRWLQCLARRGWSFEKPLDLVAHLHSEAAKAEGSSSEDGLARVQANERALAVADWDCQEESGGGPALRELWRALDAQARAAGVPRSVFED